MKVINGLALIVTIILVVAGSKAWATDGAWSSTSGGVWSNSANWVGGIVATGSDSTAYFTNTLSATQTITNNANWTVGNLVFKPASTTIGWVFTNSGSVSLTLTGAAPVVTVTGTTTAHVATVYTPLGGTAGLNINGGGKLILGTGNAYSGGTTISNVTVQVPGISGTLGTGASGAVTINGGTLVISSASSVYPTWPLTIGSGGATFQMGLLGSAYFANNEFIGSGTITLKSLTGGANRFRSPGSTQNNFSGLWVTDGITLDIPTAGWQFGNAVGDNVVTMTNRPQFNLYGNTVGSVSNGIYIAEKGTFAVSGNSLSLTRINAKITGPSKEGVFFTVDPLIAGEMGSIELLNSSNSWSGMTRVSRVAGTSVTNSYLHVGADEVIPNGAGKSNVMFESAGGNFGMDLNGHTETINGLSSALVGVMIDNLSAGAAKLVVGDNDATANTFAGLIMNSGGAVSLVKIGTGIQTLSGTNTYSGATVVSNGTLTVANNLSLSTNTAVTVVSPGILDLNATTQTVVSVGGSGFVSNGMLNVTSAMFPGGSNAVGTLTVTNLTLAENATIWWDYQAGSSDTNLVLGRANLPTNATVRVSWTGTFPSRATLFLSGTNVAPGGVTGWTVLGAKASTRVVQKGNEVQLVTTTGTILTLH